MTRAAAVLLLAAAACGPRPGETERLFVPGSRVEFRTGSAAAWRAGVVGAVGPCRAVFQPVPPPPAPATRFVQVGFDRLAALRIRPDSSARWVEIDVAALRQRFGGCAPV